MPCCYSRKLLQLWLITRAWVAILETNTFELDLRCFSSALYISFLRLYGFFVDTLVLDSLQGLFFWILLRALSFLPSFQNPHGIRAVTSFLRPSSSPKVQILRLAYQDSFFIFQVMACDIVGGIFPFARTSIIFGGGFELIPPCTARFSSAMVTTISANYLPNGTLLAQRGQNLRRVVETRRS